MNDATECTDPETVAGTDLGDTGYELVALTTPTPESDVP
jgi:hypothetical protein